MKFTFAHNNLNVYDLQKSLDFYKEALGLTVQRTKDADDGSFTLAFLGDQTTPHLLELTWLRDMNRPYARTSQPISRCLTPPSPNTGRWAASASKTPTWESILSKIPTATGWRSSPQSSRRQTAYCGRTKVCVLTYTHAEAQNKKRSCR